MFCSRDEVLKKRCLLINLSVFGLVLADQFTKFYFTGKSFLEGFFIYITYSENKGSAFSMFSQFGFYNYIIIFLSIAVIALMIYYRKSFIKDNWSYTIFILVFSGIIGNFIDRLFYGFVRDFIALKGMFIFNLADVYLSLAFILFLYVEYLSYRKQKFKKAKPDKKVNGR